MIPDNCRNAGSQKHATRSPRQTLGTAETGEEHPGAPGHVCRDGHAGRKASMKMI